MEDWFQENIQKPYANRKEKEELSKKTNLKFKQISNWLMYRRKKLKKVNFNEHLSLKNKIILNEFFNNQNRRPDRSELTKLQEMTALSRKRIIAWFTVKRFKNKN